MTTLSKQQQSSRENPSSSSCLNLRGIRKKKNKWEARLSFRGERLHLGLFKTREHAALAHEMVREKLKQDSCPLRMNFCIKVLQNNKGAHMPTISAEPSSSLLSKNENQSNGCKGDSSSPLSIANKEQSLPSSISKYDLSHRTTGSEVATEADKKIMLHNHEEPSIKYCNAKGEEITAEQNERMKKSGYYFVLAWHQDETSKEWVYGPVKQWILIDCMAYKEEDDTVWLHWSYQDEQAWFHKKDYYHYPDCRKKIDQCIERQNKTQLVLNPQPEYDEYDKAFKAMKKQRKRKRLTWDEWKKQRKTSFETTYLYAYI